MDPVVTIIAALFASIGGIGALLIPLLKALLNSLYLKKERNSKNIKISITTSDGSVKSIKLDSSKSETLSEAQIKKIVDILKEAQ